MYVCVVRMNNGFNVTLGVLKNTVQIQVVVITIANIQREHGKGTLIHEQSLGGTIIF